MKDQTSKEIETNSETNNLNNSINVLKARKTYIERRMHGFRYQTWILIVFSVIFGLLGYAYSLLSSGTKDAITLADYVPYIIFGAFIGASIYGYFTFLMRMTLQSKLRQIEFRLAEFNTDELKENIEENFFTKLVQINFKYLDQYYLQTQEQAEKSFKLATFASISGFIIIIIGIIMMYTDKITPAYVTTGAGIISQFISAVFFYLYNRTILKMSQYHQKLVVTQNISLALKMTDNMDKESKIKSLELIIDRLTLDVNKLLTSSKE